MAGHHPGESNSNGPHDVPPRSVADSAEGASYLKLEKVATTQSSGSPLYERPDEMWHALGVGDLGSAIGPNLPIGELAQRHLEEHPFQGFADRIKRDSVLWYEGSYDPIGIHHFKIFYDTIRALGFNRAALAIVYKHPIKSSLPYEHRYEMAKAVLERAGYSVVDNMSEDGVCLFPPGDDGLARFHVARQEALYNPKNFVLIGPDNFDRALETNILWTHIDGVKDSVSGRRRYGFRSIYNGGIIGFKDRLIVYPHLNSVHSTNIRNGEAPMLAPVREYVEKHKLYSTPSSPLPSLQQAQKAPSSPAPSKVVHMTRTTAEEMRLRRDLLIKVGLAFPWSFHDASGNYRAILGAADRSELVGLRNVFDKCRGREVANQSPKAQYYFDKRTPLATRLTSVMSEVVIGDDIQIRGEEHVTRLHDMQGSRIIFIANESGWGDVPVFTHALNVCRLGGLVDNLTCVYNRDVFGNSAVCGLVGHATTVIKPIPFLCNASQEERKAASTIALRAGLNQLGHGSLVVFPEESPTKRALFELDTIGPSVIGELKSYVEINGDPDITADKIFLVPVGMVGSSYLNSSRATEPFSPDYPAVVSFGAPLSATQLLELAEQHGNSVVGHVLGHRIADLLPTEWRGTYATGAEQSGEQKQARLVADSLPSDQEAR